MSSHLKLSFRGGGEDISSFQDVVLIFLSLGSVELLRLVSLSFLVYKIDEDEIRG